MARKPGLDDGADIVSEGRADDSSANDRNVPADDFAADPSEERETGSGVADDRTLSSDRNSGEMISPHGTAEPDRIGDPGPADAPGSVATDDARMAAAPGSDTLDAWRPRPSPEAVDDGSSAEAMSAVPPAAERNFPADRDGRSGAGNAPPFSPSVPTQRRNGFGALLLGGMIAAALGAGAAWFAQDRLGLLPLQMSPETEARLAALEARPLPDEGAVQGLVDRLDQVEARIAALEETSTATDVAPLRAELVEAAQASEARASALEQRIAILEAAPAPRVGTQAPLGSLAAPEASPSTPAATASDPALLRDEILSDLEPRLTGTDTALTELRAGLADLDARVDAVESTNATVVSQVQAAMDAATEVEARTSAAEREARVGSALAVAQAALESGEPLAPALAELDAAGVALPEALSLRADEGVATLAALRDAFPDAARAALSVARDQGLVQDGAGVVGFLREQLSVRSVTPREGQDPDAVLSRAEAQLAQGNLAAALAEVETLPEPVRAAMATWIDQARARTDAASALATLRDARTASEPPTPAD